MPACAKPAPAPAPPKPPETITLKFSTWTVPKGGFANSVNTFLDKIEQRTNNRVKWERYWMASLIPAKTEVAGIGKGMADLTVITSAYAQDALSLVTVGELPGFPVELETHGDMLIKLVEMVPAIHDQFTANNLHFTAFQTSEAVAG